MSDSILKYSYESQWPIFAMSLHSGPSRLTMAICSGKPTDPLAEEEQQQRVQVLEPVGNEGKMEVVCSAEHPYPLTKLLWKPLLHGDDGTHAPEVPADGALLGGSSNGMTLWKYQERQLKCLGNLKTNKPIPLTGFDWNKFKDQRIVGCSIDSTCVIWDAEHQKVESQLIAHDKPVFDVTWGPRYSTNPLFATVGEDGSMRIFDSRSLQHSTIIFETTPTRPLTRLAWNPNDKNLLACLPSDLAQAIIIDVRRPNMVATVLGTNGAVPNSLAWSPASRHHMLLGTEDGTAMVWDTTSGFRPEPAGAGAGADKESAWQRRVHAYQGEGSVHHVEWCQKKGKQDWAAILRDASVELVQM